MMLFFQHVKPDWAKEKKVSPLQYMTTTPRLNDANHTSDSLSLKGIMPDKMIHTVSKAISTDDVLEANICYM